MGTTVFVPMNNTPPDSGDVYSIPPGIYLTAEEAIAHKPTFILEYIVGEARPARRWNRTFDPLRNMFWYKEADNQYDCL